ncbi:phosphomevalonate kinase [Gulosibacter chungangensis]|uniref:Phosphomevalonate kinase n=1 Tax=Gulosibacter chungangensis TaxID=979746 RepID=A0A7J5BIU2_9MICO|nr:phosphomevalonate kinase [Gulosibacter chungangensis]
METKAPGKLYIAGEYAVVEPGEPSVIVAVDRVLTVKLTPSDDLGRVFSSEYGLRPVVWTRDDDDSIQLEHRPFDYVMAAIAVTERLRGERGYEPRYFDLHIESELDDSSGRKFGLGSSAAVVVATIAAINDFYALGLTPTERFKLALLSTARVAPRSSGGDLAASTFGGWIRYTSPDRDALLEDLECNETVSETLGSAGWDDFSVTQLPEPETLELLVGWTGSPASTERLVKGVEKRTPVDSTSHEAFLAESRGIVDALVSAMQAQDASRTLELIRAARTLLQGLGETTGIQIETEKLHALCEIAESHGAAAKPSGAGGGDCGIVLAGPETDNDAIFVDWQAAGISRLGLGVYPSCGEADVCDSETDGSEAGDSGAFGSDASDSGASDSDARESEGGEA